MGFLRKATFVATGGASGLVVDGNSKKERSTKAAEEQLALERQAEKRAVQRRMQAQIAAGAWWLDSNAFKGLSPASRNVHYLGGWQGEPSADPTRTGRLRLSPAGVNLTGTAKSIVKFPWGDVDGIEVEGIDAYERSAVRVSVTIKDDKKPIERSVLVISTRSSGEVLFLVDGFAPEAFATKLAPVVERLRVGQKHAAAARPTLASEEAASGH